MENNYYMHVSNQPMSYLFFKKAFKVHLGKYHVHSYSYEDNDIFAKAISQYPYQNAALHIINGMVSVTFNGKDGNGLIVFDDFQFDLMTFKDFLERGFIEELVIAPMEDFTTIMDTLSEKE